MSGSSRGGTYSALPTSAEEDETEDELISSYSMGLYQRWQSGEFTIVPESNVKMDIWDVLVITALLTTALLVPYEVAFAEGTSWQIGLLNHLLDFIFTVDVIMTFFVAYPVSSPMARDCYEKAPLKIIAHYTAFPLSDNLEAGWFWVDVVTLIPWHNICSSGKSVRLVRILRLMRMFRLVRVVKLFNRWHAHFGMSFAIFSLAKCLVLSLLTLHWLACIWSFCAMNALFEEYPSWLTRRAAYDERNVYDYTHFEIYNLALYFSTMTLTSVGYGDIRPAGAFEVALATCMMIWTGFTWSCVLATTVNVVTNMDTYTSRFHDRMDELNLLMQSRGLDPMFRWRLRKYMHESFNVHRQRHHQTTIEWLSEGLQGELAMQSGFDRVCSKIWYLRDLKEDVLIDLAGHLKAEMFGPNEFIQERRKVFVIRRGSCISKARILTRDDIVGEDMILCTDYLRDSTTPRSLNFLEAVSLSRADLYTVCEQHPAFSRRIRSAQIKLAIWRGIIYAAKQIQVKGSTWERMWTDRFQHSKVRVSVSGGKDDRGSDSDVLKELQRLTSLTEHGVQRISVLEARLDAFEGRISSALSGLSPAGPSYATTAPPVVRRLPT